MYPFLHLNTARLSIGEKAGVLRHVFKSVLVTSSSECL